jgi:diguanylate cyclase (GGDEF)-like protein
LRTESRRRTELERELAALAQTDALTKLPNRRGLDIVMEREFKRAERTGEIVGLLLIDADRFKSFNDMFGHQAGDELLRRFADCIADAARRGTDFAARYGGEEFAVLITGIKPGMLESVAETVRANIHALAMHHPAGPGGIATVSIGMACVTSGDTPATLIAGADKALYAAKSAGRDTILADDSVRMLASSHIRLAA